MEYVIQTGKAANKMGGSSTGGGKKSVLAQFRVSKKEAEEVWAISLKLSFEVWKIHKEMWKREGSVEIVIQESGGSRKRDYECGNNEAESESHMVRKEEAIDIECT